jgi:hypothetical protein
VRLRELGVHLGRGYLFGRPQPLSDGSPSLLTAAATADPDLPKFDPVALVHPAFTAFAGRDLDTLLGLCHPKIVLRPHPMCSVLAALVRVSPGRTPSRA